MKSIKTAVAASALITTMIFGSAAVAQDDRLTIPCAAQAVNESGPWAGLFDEINNALLIMATTAQFVTGSAVILESLLCGLAYAIAGFGSSIVWSGAGVWVGRLLSTDLRLKVFNFTMALLIASFVIYLFKDDF